MIAPCPICGNPRLTVSRRGVVGNWKCNILAALIILSSFYAAAAEKKYVVTAPDSSAPCDAAFNSKYYITRVPPNHALEVLETRKTETKISVTYFRVRYCGLEGWISEHFTTGKTFASPPPGSATQEAPVKILFAKKVDNIRKAPNGSVLFQTRALECYEWASKEGRWYKLNISGVPSAYVHESVVVPEEEGRKMVLAAVAKEQKRANETIDEKTQRIANEYSQALNDVFRAVGSQILSSIAVRSLGNDSWKAIITVGNDWHGLNYQVRLQFAQALQRGFAATACPKAPDLARIQIVDLMGNEVGGSRWLGGTLVWVDK